MSASISAVLLSILMFLLSLFSPLSGVVGATAFALIPRGGGSSVVPAPVQPLPVDPGPAIPVPVQPTDPAVPSTQPPAPAGGDGVWLLTEVIDSTNGISMITWEYRDDGALTKYSSGGSYTSEYWDHDDNGFERQTSNSSSTYEYVDGNMVRETKDSGIASEYEYYPNGQPQYLHYFYTGTGPSARYDTFYNEKGLAETYYNGLSDETLVIEYTYDSNGYVEAFRAAYEGEDWREYTCDTDDYGNIVAVYNADGAKLISATYQYFADPCLAARLYSVIRMNGFVTRGVAD